MNTAEKKLAAIQSALAEGRAIYVRNALKNWKVTPATAHKWEKSGHALFRVAGESLLMASGRKFLCIDYCRIDVDRPSSSPSEG